MRPKLVILTDSRGRNFKDKLRARRRITHVSLVVNYNKGATLQEREAHLRRQLRSCYKGEDVTAVVAAGICNFTTKTGEPHLGNVQTFYLRCKEKIRRVKDAIKDLISLTKKYKLNLILSTIPPADLVKSRENFIKKRLLKVRNSIYSIEELNQQQKELEADIEETNAYIEDICVRKGITYSHLSRAITEKSVKNKKRGKPRTRVRFNYTHLKDGVHPDSDLEDSWCNIIECSVLRKIPATNLSGETTTATATATQSTVTTSTTTPTTSNNCYTTTTSPLREQDKQQRLVLLETSYEDTQSEEESIAYKRRKTSK